MRLSPVAAMQTPDVKSRASYPVRVVAQLRGRWPVDGRGWRSGSVMGEP